MELLITVLGLLAAIYAVVPRERQLDLRLRIGFLDLSVIVCTALAVLYLEFYDFCAAHHWVLTSRTWPEGITPKNTTYLVMLGAAIFIALRVKFTHLTKGKVFKFRELVEELYWAESYGELFTIVQTHLEELFRIYDSDFVLARFRNRLNNLTVPSIESQILLLSETTTQERRARRSFLDRWPSFLWPVAPVIVQMLPRYDRAQEAARELVRGVFLSPKFLSGLTRTRPYLGLEIIRHSKPSFERFDFVELALNGLLRDSQSILYREVRNNQDVMQDRYVIAESNPIIHFFFADVKVAENNRVYKPIGDFILSDLDELARDHANDPYNRAFGDFQEVGSWHSSVFVGIQIFDIMVKEALFQGIEWHMWLYYMPLIVERISRNYRLGDPLADEDGEFPIRYGYLLYRVFSCLCDWIRALEHISPDQANVVLKYANTEHENGNIPKSSILALSQCGYLVLQSEHITERQKGDLLDMVFDLYFELRSSGKFDAYARVLLSSVAQGKSYRSDNQEYRRNLAQVFSAQRMEYQIRHPRHVLDVEQALNS